MSEANIEGQRNEFVTESPVATPGLNIDDFSSGYYSGAVFCTTTILDVNVHDSGSFDYLSGNNPAGACYYSGNFELAGSTNITGMLIVDGDLTISGAGNVISAVKSWPGLVISGELIMEEGGKLEINGLAQLGQRIVITGVNAEINVTGALFIVNGGIDGAYQKVASIVVTAAPDKAAIEIWPSGNRTRWSPAGGAFFRSIERQ